MDFFFGVQFHFTIGLKKIRLIIDLELTLSCKIYNVIKKQ